MANFKRKKNQQKQWKRSVRHGYSSESKNQKEKLILKEFIEEKRKLNGMYFNGRKSL